MKKFPADYPSKHSLTETEANNALQFGPDLAWFEPWAERAINISDVTTHAYGYTHVYSSHGSFNYDFASWPTKEGLALGLEDLWRDHTGRGFTTTDRTFPKCQDCQGVVYFAPDEPLRLYLVIEQDDDEDDPSDDGGADQ
ncbi:MULTISPECIES: hypothetical protein [Microbacterium]|uniref:hypothetical protein n=1 Tax=Microbacterium TaxID=33882 RepID=UPI000F5F68E9|nr:MULTISPECIES: hypothetical protein [Microbacterium]AZH79147.1 hypothetical protein CSX12_12170 [Microbacterium sp. Y-01]MBM7464989.1 hypothetical protein [Microbacterium esteraromaticum]